MYYADKAIIFDESNTEAQYLLCDSLYNLKMFEEAYERVTVFLINDPYNIEMSKMKDKLSLKTCEVYNCN